MNQRNQIRKGDSALGGIRPPRRKLNNIVIDAIPIKGLNHTQPKGHEMFPYVSPNIALIAKKKSGKTNLLYHILRQCLGKNTIIHIFCSSAGTDPVWKDIINHFEKQGNEVDVHVGIYEMEGNGKGKRRKKINQLEKILLPLESESKKNTKKKKRGKGKKKKEIMKEGREERKRSPFDRKITFADLPEHHLAHSLFTFDTFDKNETETERDPPQMEQRGGHGGKSPRKSPPNVPARIFIFDDLSNELNDPLVAKLLKGIRHYDEDKGGSMCIISTQYVNDIPPTARSQFDFVLAFKGHRDIKVETIRKMMDSQIDEQQFLDMYHEATAEPYSFLYCNCRDSTYRINFDTELN